MNDKLNILGIKIWKLSKREVLDKIKQFLSIEKQHYLVTPNAEIILNANEHDEELFYILNQADLAIADGIALKFAAWAMGKNLKRYAGADLVKDTLAMAEKNDIKVVVLNWQSGLSTLEDIRQALKRDYPKLQLFVDGIDRLGAYHFDKINQFAPEILYVTLGSPWQEKFVYHNLKQMPSVKIGLGIGGSFDYLTGELPRAPKTMRQLGLEWLWRLFKQPKRWRRIYRAVIVFPFKFFFWRFISPLFYRPNVACMLYKKDGDGYKILLAERSDWPGHWQLPQGGTDGENLMNAGARELKEEIGTDKFRSVAVFKNLWRYNYENKISGQIPALYKTLAKKSGNKGQKQGLFIAEYLGHDTDIKVNFWDHKNWQWINVDNFLATIHPVRRQAYELYLEKFKEVISHGK